MRTESKWNVSWWKETRRKSDRMRENMGMVEDVPGRLCLFTFGFYWKGLQFSQDVSLCFKGLTETQPKVTLSVKVWHVEGLRVFSPECFWSEVFPVSLGDRGILTWRCLMTQRDGKLHLTRVYLQISFQTLCRTSANIIYWHCFKLSCAQSGAIVFV